MKLKKTLLLGLSAILLASCTGETNPSSIPGVSASTEPTSSIIPSSSSDGKMSAEAALLYFLRKQMKPANTTLSIRSAAGSTTVKYYMGGDAIVFDQNGTLSGVLVNGEQGIFEFEVGNDNSITLGQSFGRETDVTETMWNPSYLSNETERNIWTIGDEGYMYTCNKAATTYFGAYATMLVLGNSGYIQYLSSMTLKLADDLSSATLKLRYTVEGQIYTYTGTFSKFGTTSVKAVEDYLKNPTPVPNATDFSKTAKTISAALFGDASITPFPTGLVDYAFRDDYITDDSNHAVGFQWTYYGNDLTSAYTNILTTKGYVVAQEPEVDKNGNTVYTYKYVLEEPTATTPEKAAVAQFYYDSSDESFVCQFSRFVGPVVTEVASISELNSIINEKNALDEVVFDLPTFDENSAITKITFTDASEKFESDYSFYYYIEMDIADQAVAMTYLKAFEAKLLAGSYSEYTAVGVTLDKDGSGVYLAHNADQTKYSLVELDHGTSNTTPTYNGSIGIVFYGI